MCRTEINTWFIRMRDSLLGIQDQHPAYRVSIKPAIGFIIQLKYGRWVSDIFE